MDKNHACELLCKTFNTWKHFEFLVSITCIDSLGKAHDIRRRPEGFLESSANAEACDTPSAQETKHMNTDFLDTVL